jgi:hypothetical protein
MPRYSVALAVVLMHTLIGIVCAMPGMGPPGSGPGLAGRTIQCPGCGRHFKTHRAVRQHQARMAKSSKCYKDLRPPIPSGWASGGARAAGRAENLSRGGRLPGMTDSDTGSNGARSPRQMDPDEQPLPAAALDSDVNPGPADPFDQPADPADEMQVKILSYTSYTFIYIHINTYKYIYIQIHTYTYRYIHLVPAANTVGESECRR